MCVCVVMVIFEHDAHCCEMVFLHIRNHPHIFTSIFYADDNKNDSNDDDIEKEQIWDMAGPLRWFGQA